MNATSKRLIAYSLSAVIIGGLCWFGFGYKSEADFGTLVSSASIHAELAASIPLESTKPGILDLRRRLIRESYEWLARADRVQPDSMDASQLRAYLSMIEGRPEEAAERYRACRARADAEPGLLAPLALHEAKARSNAGDFEGALGLLDAKIGTPDATQGLERDALRVRVLHRLGRQAQAIAAAEAMIEAGVEGDAACRVAAEMLESMGALGAAEAGWSKGEVDQDVRQYHLARLKVRSGETDEGHRLLATSLHDRDVEVLRRLQNDRKLWIDSVGEESVEALLGIAAEPSASPKR